MTYEVKLTVIVSDPPSVVFWRASAKCDDPAPGYPGVISVTGDSPERALRSLAYEMGDSPERALRSLAYEMGNR